MTDPQSWVAPTLNGLADLLTGRPRSDAGPTAPAHGLTLETVSYPVVVVA